MHATSQDLRTCKAEVEQRLNSFAERLTAVEANTQRTLEIVEAWNSAKGFVNVIRWVSAALKVLWWPIVFIAAVIVFFKTGNWQWPGK